MNYKKKPEKVYLQWHLRDDPDGMTWCVDKIEDNDIEYIRTDVALRQASELRLKNMTALGIAKVWAEKVATQLEEIILDERSSQPGSLSAAIVDANLRAAEERIKELEGVIVELIVWAKDLGSNQREQKTLVNILEMAEEAVNWDKD